ncbi:hypothetical protein DVH26_20045 [Paenibacillus sp. H1-7]|uniref:hypothetical protein n=1 Tax=Paenibacillus sp. H1-7 TaxID=2282849 RepID=UPI001EF91EA7|nr:hypothetical protein [Paenibacillus sp. H1-7]ULL16530.1 hypothetical protein DVH26_20045 [Paenibacillus sp. H1-7]
MDILRGVRLLYWAPFNLHWVQLLLRLWDFAGENSAIPFGIVIFTTSLLAILSNIIFIRKVETVSGGSNNAETNT